MEPETDEATQLYQASLEGLAISQLDGKLEFAVRKDLKTIADEFKCDLKTVRHDYKHILHIKRQENEKPEMKVSAGPTVEIFSQEVQERAMQIWNCSDKECLFEDDFNKTGYLADQPLCQIVLFALSLQLINIRTWGLQNKSIKGIQIGFSGSSAGGKSELVSHMIQFLDPSLIAHLTSTSDQYLIYRGGPDGKALCGKYLNFGELVSPGPKEYTNPMHITWQLTTEGVFVRGTIREAGGSWEPVEISILGPIISIFTTVNSPSEFEQQYSNRTVWGFVHNDQEKLAQIHKLKLKRQLGKMPLPEKELIWKSWQCVMKHPSIKKLDPSDPEAFADVEMPYLDEAAEMVNTPSLAPDDLRRLDFLHLMIAAHAMLNQAHRQIKTRKEDNRLVLVSDVSDFNAVLPMFKSCILSEQDQSAPASAEAFLKVVEKLHNNAMTIDDLTDMLKKSKRTIWNYVHDWLLCGAAIRSKEDGKTLIEIGPAVTRLIHEFADAKGADVDDINAALQESVLPAAKYFLSTERAYQPKPLLQGPRVGCHCSLHCADVQSLCNEPPALSNALQIEDVPAVEQSKSEAEPQAQEPPTKRRKSFLQTRVERLKKNDD